MDITNKGDYSFSNLVVVIAEPVGSMRLTIAGLLDNINFKKIIQAGNGAEVLTIMEHEKVDIVISEYELPKVGGIELLKKIRKNPQTAMLPFILLSSTIEHDEVIEAIKNGVSEYVVKPFSINILKKRIISSILHPIKSTATSVKSSIKKLSEESNKKFEILIVDDTATNIHLAANILRDEYKIRGAISGEKALKICQSASVPDLILLDIVMPGMDGMEVCRLLKSNPVTQHIPIIFLTALEQTEKVVEGLSLGAIDYITKPINSEIIKARVKTHINTLSYNKLLQQQVSTMVENIQMRDKFDRILQNDLKSPITQIYTAIDDIEKSKKSPNAISNLSKNLKLSTTLLSNQIDNMITLYKLEDGSYQLDAVNLSLTKIIKNIFDTFSLSAANNKLEIKTDFIDEHYFQGEELLTSSLIANIFKNAIEAAPRGSRVNASISIKGEFQVLEITNRGEVPSDIQPFFFEKYVTFGKKNAVGIGSYAAKLMVEIQRGTIALVTTEKSTTLVISLPVKETL